MIEPINVNGIRIVPNPWLPLLYPTKWRMRRWRWFWRFLGKPEPRPQEQIFIIAGEAHVSPKSMAKLVFELEGKRK